MITELILIFFPIAFYIVSTHLYIQQPYNSVYSFIFWIVSILLIFIYIVYKERVTIHQTFNLREISFVKFFNSNKLLILIVLLGITVRFWNLTSIPILTHDEANDAGLFPQKVIAGELKDYFGSYYALNNNFFVLASISHLIVADPILKVRLFSALFGVLSILLIYKLTKSMYNRKIALISAFLLSVYHVHIHFSRTEFSILFDSFYTLIIFIFFNLLVKSWKMSYVILLAIILGFGLHFYSGLRAITLLVFIAFLFFAFIKLNYKRAISSVIVFMIFFLIALGPLLVVLTTRKNEAIAQGTATFVFSQNQNFNSTLNNVAINYKDSILAYVKNPIDFHYNYGGPFLVAPFSIFFLLGFILSFSKIKKPIHFLIIISVIGIPFFNSAIFNQINYTHRLLSLVPLIILLTSFGIEKIAELLKNFINSKIALLFIVSFCIYFAFYNINLYFYKNIWEKTLNINEFRAWEAQKIINNVNKDTTTLFIGNDYYPSYKSVPPLEYLTQKHQIIDIIDKEKLYQIFNYKNVNNYLLIIMPDNKAMVYQRFLIKYLYPDKINSKKIYYKNMYLFDILRITKSN